MQKISKPVLEKKVFMKNIYIDVPGQKQVLRCLISSVQWFCMVDIHTVMFCDGRWGPTWIVKIRDEQELWRLGMNQSDELNPHLDT